MYRTFLSLLLLFFFSLDCPGQELFSEIKKLTPLDRIASEGFGGDTDLDENWAIIVSPSGGDAIDDPIRNSAKVYFFYRDPTGNWSEKQSFSFENPTDDPSFYYDAALKDSIAVIGLRDDNTDANGENEIEGAGAAIVMMLNQQGDWEIKDKLVATDRFRLDRFGARVNTDGKRIIVGATGHDFDSNGENEIAAAGAAYIFEQDASGLWFQSQKIVAENRERFDGFGNETVIRDSIAIIGCSACDVIADDETRLFQAGAVYAFRLTQEGFWKEEQRIISEEPELRAEMGQAIALEQDTIIVGAAREDQDSNGANPVDAAGIVYVFVKDQTGNWSQLQRISAPIRAPDDLFGSNVDANGDRIIIGALFDDEDDQENNFRRDAGAAYIYQKDFQGYYQLERKITPARRRAEDRFGESVSLSADYVLVGSNGHDFDDQEENFLNAAGAAYLFHYAPPGNFCSTATPMDTLVGGEPGATISSPQLSNERYTLSNQEPTVGMECFTEGSDQPWQNSRWFTFTGDGNVYRLEITGCGDIVPIAQERVQFSVFTGSCGALSPVTCAQGDTTNIASQEIITEPGIVYYVVVDGARINDVVERGEFCIELTNIRPSSTRTQAKNTIKVYPNPTNDYLFLDAISVEKVEIFSTAGYKVGTYSQTNEINVSRLPAGTYHLRAFNREAIFVAKFIVNR